MSSTKHVLISNDDGIDAHGIGVLVDAISALDGYRVTVVAPHDQQSASSHSLTLTSPLRIIDHGPGRYAVTGTPTDAVTMGLRKVIEAQPDVILSGVNRGANLADDADDIIYTGLVAKDVAAAFIGFDDIDIRFWNGLVKYNSVSPEYFAYSIIMATVSRPLVK